MTADKLNQAIALIKAGNRAAALPILKELVQANPQDENTWLWLYACVDEAEQKKFCLQKALEINPGNRQAQLALQKLGGSGPQAERQGAAPSAMPGAGISKDESGGQPRRPFWLLALGASGLLLCLCLGAAVVLAQTGQWPALAANLPLFSTATLTPSLTPTPSATFTASPAPTVTLTATATPLPAATGTPASTATSSSGIVPLEALASYRLKGKSSSKSGFGGSISMESTTSYTKEWDKASQAHRTIEVVSFDVTAKQTPTTMESISIGRTTWSKINDNWMRVDSQQVPAQQNEIDWQSMKLVGDETINGIPCKHYTVDEDIMKMSGLGDRLDMTTHAKGDIWVANRADLPRVILREKIQTQISGGFFSNEMGIKTATPDPLMEAMTQEPQGMVSDDEYEVTDINTVIVIEPPEATAAP